MEKTYEEELNRIQRIAKSLGFRAEIKEVVKENYGKLKGVQIFPRQDSRGAAVIYPSSGTLRLNDLELRDKILEAAAQAEAYEKRMTDIATLDVEKLRMHVCGIEQNREMLMHCPHQEKDGIAFVPYLDYGDAIVMASHSLVAAWDIDTEELFAETWKQSMKHEPATIEPLNDIIEEEAPEEALNVDQGLLCVTNAAKHYGGACLFYPGVMEKLFARFNGTYFAIPSSIHEWLVYPANRGLKAADLTETLHSVNQTLEKRDILSEHLYYFDGKDLVALG